MGEEKVEGQEEKLEGRVQYEGIARSINGYADHGEFAVAEYLLGAHKDIPKDSFYAAIVLGLSKKLDQLGEELKVNQGNDGSFSATKNALEELIGYYKSNCSHFKKEEKPNPLPGNIVL